MTARVHETIDTVYHADSVEWCPVEGFQDLLLCGTYQLEENENEKTKDEQTANKQVRVGRLYLYKLTAHGQQLKLEKIWERDMPGILDIKWSTKLINDKVTFGLVNAVGCLQVYFLDREDYVVTMKAETKLCQGGLGLSLDWDNVLQAQQEPYISASDSDGCVSVYKVGSAETLLDRLHTWHAHDFEAWITAFNQWDPNVIFTGGDDCLLKGWDHRTDCTKSVFTSKRHTMGVCSIQSSPVHEHIIATGSYDEQLLVWDSRQMKRPVADLGLGGGIWRIKWEPCTGNSILTATMYNGFHVVDSSSVRDGGLKVVTHFQEHQSIGYGSDWCRLHLHIDEGNLRILSTDADNGTSDFRHIIATCSFYDHTLKLWDWRLSDSDGKNL